MELLTIPLELDEQDTEAYLIYRPLACLAFVGNQAMVELARHVSRAPLQFAAQVENESIAFLAKNGFFLDDPDLSQENPPPYAAVLLLTNRCQLRCVYCYAAAGEFAPKQLKVSTGKVAIDYACEQARQKNQPSFQVDFHGGGEPTMEWKTLQELTKYARSQPLPSKISITSNAIWSEQQCNWLMKNMDTISVSMDGSATTQDRQRPLANQKSSSSAVMRNLHRLDDGNFRYGIRMTAFPPWAQLVDNVRFILENTACRNIQVEPAFNDRRGEHCPPKQDQEESFLQAFIDAYEFASEHHASFHYSGARPYLVSRVFCSAPYHALIVNPEDEVVACYEVVDRQHPNADIATFGRISNGQVEIDQSKRQHLHDLLAERLVTCRSCFCYWSCAGDCFTRAFGDGEEAHLAKSRRCKLNREITLHMILSLIERHGGVWQEEDRMDENQYG